MKCESSENQFGRSKKAGKQKFGNFFENCENTTKKKLYQVK